MRNIRFLLEYHGAAYAGWQRQPDLPTVQGAIEDALKTILGAEISVTGAGRTDAGVHARGQVANARIDGPAPPITPSRLMAALNGVLPSDIAVLACQEVPEDFHARFSARSRRYSYTIATVQSALDRDRAWFVPFMLSDDTLAACTLMILGSHDFSSFCRAESPENRICTVTAAAWRRTPGRLVFGITADRFLHGMVRSLVGTMVDAGRGYISTGEFASAMAAARRTEGGPAAPAHGLVLEEVGY
jgi:tRNA pseudouridine38-40 synthase